MPSEEVAQRVAAKLAEPPGKASARYRRGEYRLRTSQAGRLSRGEVTCSSLSFISMPMASFVPHVRDEQRRLQQVAAAAMPGPQYWFLSCAGKRSRACWQSRRWKIRSPRVAYSVRHRRGWGSNYNCVLLRSSLREMTDLVTLIDSIARPIWGKAVSYNRLNHVYEWRTGERLELNYYVDDGTWQLYQGKNHAVIAWEELTLQKNLDGYLKMFSYAAQRAARSSHAPARAVHLQSRRPFAQRGEASFPISAASITVSARASAMRMDRRGE